MLRFDPELLPLLRSFTGEIAGLGFTEVQETAKAQDIAGQGILRRFRRGADQPFPIMQIGPGLYASNDGPTYEWKRYRKQILDGAKVLLATYPSLPGYPLTPEQLELRYIDMFDETSLQTVSMNEFVQNGTTMVVSAPPFLEDPARFDEHLQGRVIFTRSPKGRADTVFTMDFGTVLRGEQRALRLETKVVTTGKEVPILRSPNQFLEELGEWLDFAHGLTSPFFKSFVTTDLMKRFEAPAQ